MVWEEMKQNCGLIIGVYFSQASRQGDRALKGRQEKDYNMKLEAAIHNRDKQLRRILYQWLPLSKYIFSLIWTSKHAHV